MSTEAVVTTESVCYVHCNFCNTILAVSVPCNDMFSIVTVRCGHCTNLLSVNMRALLQTLPVQDRQANTTRLVDDDMGYRTIPMINRIPFLSPSTFDQQRMLPIRSPRKKQRVPSAYNRFIKEEIQRIKASNPDISHREAFSAAAKNWAHFPHIHFGLNMEGNDQLKVNEVATAEGTGKIPGF